MEIDTQLYAAELTDSFYALFELQPAGDNHIPVADIAARRGAIIAWRKDLADKIKTIPAPSVRSLYLALQNRLADGSIGSLTIAYQQTQRERGLCQDCHPLLRAVRAAAQVKRSVQAYSNYSVDWSAISSPLMSQFGDQYERGKNKLIYAVDLFLNVENRWYQAPSVIPFEEVISGAIRYEQELADHCLEGSDLVGSPLLLRDTFGSIVEPHSKRGLEDISPDVPALMLWEDIVDHPLQALSLEQLRDTYICFRRQRFADGYQRRINQIILNEIYSVCMANLQLKPYLKYEMTGLEELPCDGRIAHLISNHLRRYPSNLEKAFPAAIKAAATAASIDLDHSRPLA